MENTNTGEKEISVAAEQEQTVVPIVEPIETGVTESVDGQQGVKSPAAEELSQVEAFKAKALDETTKRQNAEAELNVLRQQAATQQKPDVQPQKTMYDAVCEELGFGEEEYLSREQQGQVFDRINSIQSQANATQATHNQFLAKHTDFAEVVGKTNPLTGQFTPSPHLQRLMDKDPETAAAVANSPYAAQLAYKLVTVDPEYIAAQTTAAMTPEQIAAAKASEAIKTNMSSISSVNSGGGTVAKTVQSMTDAEFAAHKEQLKAKAGIG